LNSHDSGPDGDRDVYDGHANYRDSFAPKPAREVLRSFVRGLLAIGLAATITWVLHKLLHPGQNILLLFTAGFAGFVGLIGGAVGYSWLNGPKDGEQKPWSPLDAVVVAIIVFGFVIPLSIERAQEKRERRARSERTQAATRAHEEAQTRAQEGPAARLRRLGRHAAPGVAPPGFVVQDDGVTVKVTFRGDTSMPIALRRVLRDSHSPGGWRGCSLWTDGNYGEGRFENIVIDPGMTLVFSMYAPCIEEFRGAPLEYRVGEPTMPGRAGDLAWWSESAFVSPAPLEVDFFSPSAVASTASAVPADPEVTAGEMANAGEAAPLASEPETPASEPERKASEPAKSGDVVRCRDSSGATQFTQKYCPPGTTRVDSPDGRRNPLHP
jgi:hypothetical protein